MGGGFLRPNRIDTLERANSLHDDQLLFLARGPRYRDRTKKNNNNLATKPSAVLPCPEPGTISGCRYSRPLPRDIAKLGSRVDTFVSNDEDTTSGIAGSTGGVKELSKATTQFIGDVAISEARGEKEK